MQLEARIRRARSSASPRRLFLSIGLLGTICAVPRAVAVTPVVYEDDKLTASDAGPGDGLGAVDMEGNLAVALGGGQAYVYRLVGTTWTEEAILTASDGAAFQLSVAISGDVIVAGAWAATNPGPLYGAAYVFRYNGAAWIQEARLTGAGGNFGIGVDIEGDVIAVGAYTEPGAAGIQTGALYIFRYDGASWNQEARLTASDGQATDQLGRRVALDGNVVVASAWQADPLGTESGAAYVFRYNGTAWNQEAKLTAPDGAAGDRFSSDVAVYGDVILVGARFDSLVPSPASAGSAHVFRYDGSTWNHEAKLTASDAQASDSFGHLVSICRNVATVASPLHNVGGVSNSGSAYVFVYDGTSWNETVELGASDGQPNDLFGTGVAACENAILGARQEDDQGADAGALYFYRFPDTDADGLNDYHELFYGTDPADADTDDDGLLDGTEIDIAEDSGCPDALDLDSDGDTLLDGDEVALGTDPCSTDTDDDLIPDNIDPYPLDPGGTPGFIELELRGLCDFIDGLSLSLIDAKNDNARAGRQNAMCNKLNAAANAVAAGDYDDAIDQLDSLLAKLDGLPKPKDWMTDSPERDALATAVQEMIVLLELL